MEPVYDRTSADVSYAKAKVTHWRQDLLDGLTPTVVELKGCFNASDMNRIEGNVEYLKTLANVIRPGAPVQGETRTDWGIEDIPLDVDFNRVLEIIGSLGVKIGIDPLPTLPEGIGDYTDVNTIEEVLATFMINTAALDTWSRVGDFKWADLTSITWGGVKGEL